MAPRCAPAEAARRAGGREGKRPKDGRGRGWGKKLNQTRVVEARGKQRGEDRAGGADVCSTAAEGQHQPRGRGGCATLPIMGEGGASLRSPRLPEHSSRLPNTVPTPDSYLPQSCPYKAALPSCTRTAHIILLLPPAELCSNAFSCPSRRAEGEGRRGEADTPKLKPI